MPKRSPGEEKPGWGTYVGDRINSQHHQHMFCARLDLAVDDDEGGKGLQVSEVRMSISGSNCSQHAQHTDADVGCGYFSISM